MAGDIQRHCLTGVAKIQLLEISGSTRPIYPQPTLVNSLFQGCAFVRKILRKPSERSEIELSESLLVEIRVSVPQKVIAVLKLGGENRI